MLIHLYSQATTTPKVRAAVQGSNEPVSGLAERFGTTEQTVYKWKHRDRVHDRSHIAHRLGTTLTPAQEAIAVVLRKTPLVSIDDPLAVVREFLKPSIRSRAAINSGKVVSVVALTSAILAEAVAAATTGVHSLTTRSEPENPYARNLRKSSAPFRQPPVHSASSHRVHGSSES